MATAMGNPDQEAVHSSEKCDPSIKSTAQPLVLETDPTLDRRLLWKRDLVLIPMMGILYMVLFVDRTNIANARALGIGSPTGLESSLGMPNNGYNMALMIFFIPFIIIEVPANLILNLNKIRPGILLGGQMFLLGILGTCQGLTRSYGGLLAVRFFMGIFEAALPAGALYMISMYYTKREAALRFAWFLNFSLAGPLFSGLLAYALQNLEGVGGYPGWRWVFIVEGLTTVAISSFVIAFCPNLPSQAQSWFLRRGERERLLLQLEASRGAEDRGSAAEEVSLWAVLADWRIHLFAMCFFCCDITAASLASFSPTILTELGWTNTVAQLMTMPIWGSGILATFAMTWIATRTDCRAPFVLGGISCQLIGWIIMRVFVPQAGVRYMALFFMSIGTFPQMAVLFAWLSANLRGRRYLAVGMAWMGGFGNCGNFVSINVFIKEEAPRYTTGFTIGLAFTLCGFMLVSLGWMLLASRNRKREAARSLMTDAEKERYDELYFEFSL